MKIYREGEKSKAICSFCKGMKTTTFKTRDVKLSGGKGQVKDVLAGVCDTCDKVVSVPQQSVTMVRDYLEKK